MNVRIMGIALLILGTLAGASEPAYARAPIAKLVQVEGDVQYSRNGETWRPVRRTKYLFEGYQIKTGEDGSGKVIDEASGMSQELGANSLIKVGPENVSVVTGSLSAPKEESTSLFESLVNKFMRAQRYTTVRRGVNQSEERSCDNKVRTIRKVTLSPSNPDLVWRNACPEYSYRLVIDGQSHNIPAQSTAEMIRYKVTGVKPGEHTYHVEVLDKDGTVYIPRENSSFTMLSADQEKELMAKMGKFQNDPFLEANLLESNDMYVAAMDKYRSYFQDNPDDNDMRPLLIQTYQELKLRNLREKEARLYNANMDQ